MFAHFNIGERDSCTRFSTLGFFHQSTPPRALIHGLELFRIWLRIRRDNPFESRQNRFQRGFNDPAETEIKSRILQLFFCFKYKYGMGIFTYEIVFQDIPFKKMKILNFSGVNDPAEID
jgi:hypothetical protein